jgi:hypothetical protein
MNYQIYKGKIFAIALSGDTFRLKRYLRGEENYITNKSTRRRYIGGEYGYIYDTGPELQCPLLYRCTFSKPEYIKILHDSAINIGMAKKVTNYDDQYPSPFKLNSNQSIYWIVGPRELFQKGNKYNFFKIILLSM